MEEKKKKITVVMSDESAKDIVKELSELVDGMVIECGEVDEWGGYTIKGRKGDTYVTIRGYLEEPANNYVIEYRTKEVSRKIPVCGAVYVGLKELARKMDEYHFQRMAELWKALEIEIRELR